MKLRHALLIAVPTLLAQDAKAPAPPQPIPAARVAQYDAINTQYQLLAMQTCNDAGILWRDCVIDWQAKTVGTKPVAVPATSAPKPAPAKPQAEKP